MPEALGALFTSSIAIRSLGRQQPSCAFDRVMTVLGIDLAALGQAAATRPRGNRRSRRKALGGAAGQGLCKTADALRRRARRRRLVDARRQGRLQARAAEESLTWLCHTRSIVHYSHDDSARRTPPLVLARAGHRDPAPLPRCQARHRPADGHGLLLRHRPRPQADGRGSGEDRGRDEEGGRREPAVHPQGGLPRGGRGDHQDHAARSATSSAALPTFPRAKRSRSTRTASSSTCARAPTSATPRRSRPSSCSRSPAPTTAATSTTSSSSASTAPPSRRRRSSPPTSSSSSRRSTATTASSAGTSSSSSSTRTWARA